MSGGDRRSQWAPILDDLGDRHAHAAAMGGETRLARQRRAGRLDALVLGPSAGHGALAAPLADFVAMTPHASLFTAGPPLVRAALGEETTPEELGGPAVHVETSGVAHNLVPDEAGAISLARRYLGYFPSHAEEPRLRRETEDSGDRRLDCYAKHQASTATRNTR